MRAWLGLLGMVAACAANGGGAADGGGGADAAAPDATPPECTIDADCADPARPHCAADLTCAACVTNAHCDADPFQPTCDAATRACRPCARTTDCDSWICNDEDGDCILAADIYYIDDSVACAMGDGSLQAPFCDHAEARAAFVAAPRGFFHYLDGDYLLPPITEAENPVYHGGPGARVHPEAGGVCLDLVANIDFRLRGFTFTGCDPALQAAGPFKGLHVWDVAVDGGARGVQCTGSVCQIERLAVTGTVQGVRCEMGAACQVRGSTFTGTSEFALGALGSAELAVDGTTITAPGTSGIQTQTSTLTVTGSTIDGAAGTTGAAGILCSQGSCTIERTRVVNGAGAGVVILDATSFRIANSAILENGSALAGATWDGGVVLDPDPAASPREFHHNTVYGNRAMGTGGVRCTSLTSIVNSIVWGNAATQVDAALCIPISSDVDQDGLGGTANIRMDPALASTVAGAVDPHLQPGSPCIDVADPASATTDDLDGQVRPAGLGPDIGADEVQ